MNILEYTNIKEYPVVIDFMESGGPVPSGYNYLTQIRVYSKSDKIFLFYREVREFLNDKPRLLVSNEKELSQDIYKELLNDLFEHKITELNRNFITEKSSMEASNYFILELGNVLKIRFDYLLTNKDTSEFEPFENIVQLMKNLLFSNLR